MLRSAGVIDLHDEAAIYQEEMHALGGNSAVARAASRTA
jgi:hypothetical protein